jgi:hypothetical protein
MRRKAIPVPSANIGIVDCNIARKGTNAGESEGAKEH